MTLAIDFGAETTHLCGCCGKRSHVLRGFVSNDDAPYAVYMAGYTENHAVEEGTVLISIGKWTEGSTPEDRASVILKIRKIDGRFQVMVVGPEGCPWTDVHVFGPIETRQSALARPDIQEYFHVVDHVLGVDSRFTQYFDAKPKPAKHSKRRR